MRIAFVCGFAWQPKGTVRARAFPLAVELAKLGHEVTLFAVPYDNPFDSGREWVDLGVRIKNIELAGGLLRVVINLIRLIREVSRYAPDLVHVFKPKGYAGAAALWFLTTSRPLALDCDDWEGWGGWNDVSPYPWVVKEFIDILERLLIRMCPVVTVASMVLMHRAQSLGKRKAELFYVPNGFPSLLGHVKEVEEKRNPRSPLIVFYAGHFHPADDVSFLCESTLDVLKSTAATLQLVGEGRELDNVKDFYEKHPGVHVQYLGRLEHPAYLDVLRRADVTVFPYPDNPVYRAKCSVRIVEYMAMGKPVLTTDVGQNREYIVPGESGILVPAGDKRAFANALGRLLADRELRQRLGDNARWRAYDNFQWSQLPLQGFLGAYNHLNGASCGIVIPKHEVAAQGGKQS